MDQPKITYSTMYSFPTFLTASKCSADPEMGLLGGGTWRQARRSTRCGMFVNKQDIKAVAVSRDGRWVINIIGEDPSGDRPGGIKVCNVETGVVKTFKGHSPGIICIDISVDSKLLASGVGDGFRIWNYLTSMYLLHNMSSRDAF
jgi:WD40 repeat protein